jgi:hypothetical protein
VEYGGVTVLDFDRLCCYGDEIRPLRQKLTPARRHAISVRLSRGLGCGLLTLNGGPEG